jgi:phosphomevalonate kinase
MKMDDALVCSCPGKVLLSGGYLVLDRAYNGLVAATTSRFYAILKEPSRLEPLPGHAKCFHIQVVSPQFKDAEWNYELSYDKDSWHLTKFGH